MASAVYEMIADLSVPYFEVQRRASGMNPLAACFFVSSEVFPFLFNRVRKPGALAEANVRKPLASVGVSRCHPVP